jgi:hypothetical protein
MLAKDPLVYIMHIRDSCRRIAEYTSAGSDDWTSKPMTMDAVCRNITIIGEAARKTRRLLSAGAPGDSVVCHRRRSEHRHARLRVHQAGSGKGNG